MGEEKEKNGSKRKTIGEMLQQSGKEQLAKKAKKTGYQLETELIELIENDRLNAKLWDECQESAFKPVTTTCFHNICLNCLQRSFRAGVYNCPHCRHELGKNLEMEPNEQLCKALNAIFPGYENGR